MKLSKKAKRRLFATLIILTPILTYGLWPLGNPKYDIVFDAKKIEYRENYLKDLVDFADSVKRPNIIIILADDLGKMDVSLYGGKNVSTKNIDAIGQNGATFNQAYISSPICAPSRAGLLTGRYQQRFGFEINTHERYPTNRIEYYGYKWLYTNDVFQLPEGLDEIAVPTFDAIHKQGLPPTEFILPELLKKHGYATAAMGKWHLGYNETARPMRRGFDYHYGFLQAFSLYAPVEQEGIVNKRLDDFTDGFLWEKARTGNCAIQRNGKVIEEKGYLTNRIAEESTQWMEAHKEEPFFMYIPFSAPHTPFQATQEYYDKYAHVESPEKRIYYAMIHALDDAVGTIMDKLKELELEENTMVIFLSDNGGATYTVAPDNSPLKGGKLTNFEGGINIPFMVQWKGHIPAGITYKNVISSLDIFRTATDLAQCQMPEKEFDGVNFLPYLLDSNYVDKKPHDVLYWRSCGHKAILKYPWKMVKDYESNVTQLYNLQNDISEKKNLAKEEPKMVKQFESELIEWEKGLIDSRWPRVINYRNILDGEVYYFPL
jgi:arylsulfatase A-like enzyme